MTDAQTEARAIARLEYVHGSDGYALRPDAGGRYVLYDDHATALAAKEAELAALEKSLMSIQSACGMATVRAERAEAQLAEARKALGMMLKEHDILSGNFGDVMDPKHKRPDRWPTAAEAARRALEA